MYNKRNYLKLKCLWRPNTTHASIVRSFVKKRKQIFFAVLRKITGAIPIVIFERARKKLIPNNIILAYYFNLGFVHSWENKERQKKDKRELHLHSSSLSFWNTVLVPASKDTIELFSYSKIPSVQIEFLFAGMPARYFPIFRNAKCFPLSASCPWIFDNLISSTSPLCVSQQIMFSWKAR